MKRIEIFRAGKRIADSGETIDFTESQLAASVAAYDPAKHEAPLVVGHPKSNGPAYGWVKGMGIGAGGLVDIEPTQVHADFAELVNSGAYKKISASWYLPDAPNNPVPGVYYLRHVGFLGAQPPSIKGLRDASFAEKEEGVVEFSDGYTHSLIGRLFRRVREFLIETQGQEKADAVLPSWDVEALAETAARETAVESPNPYSFQEHALSTEHKKQLDDRTADLEKREKAIKDREQQQLHQAHASFAEKLETEGRLLPVHKPGLIAFLDGLPADTTIEFGEGADAKKEPGKQWLQGFLQAQPKVVDFAERGAGAELPDLTDSNVLAAGARNYQEAQRKAGRDISIAVAMTEFTKQGQ